MSTSTFTTHSAETTNGTITSWLPVTTPFPLQAGCSSAIQWRSGFPHAVAFDPGYGIDVDEFATCQPPAVTSWWESDDASLTALGVTTRFSIGPIVCPTAYTTATTSVDDASSTQVFCCPSSYDFVSSFLAGVIGECTSPLSRGQIFTYVDGNFVTTKTTMASTNYVIGVPVNGYNFKEAEAQVTNSSTSSISSATATAISEVATQSSTSSGISGGAIAGIVIGSVAVVAALIGILAWVCMKRRRDAKNLKANAAQLQANAGEKTNHYSADPSSLGSPTPRYQDPTHSELDGGLAASEMDGTLPHHELPSNRHTAYEMPG